MNEHETGAAAPAANPLATFIGTQEHIAEAICAEGAEVLDVADLGSADVFVFRDDTKASFLVVTSSAGKAIKIPVAYFARDW